MFIQVTSALDDAKVRINIIHIVSYLTLTAEQANSYGIEYPEKMKTRIFTINGMYNITEPIETIDVLINDFNNQY